MADLDLEMESVLRRVRAATEPSQRQVSRLLEGVQLELAGAGLAGTDALRSEAPRVPAPHPAALAQQPTRFGAQLRFVSWGALTAAAGFWLGIQYARGASPFAESPSVAATQAPAVPSAESSSATEPMSAEAPALPNDEAHAAARASAAEAVGNAPTERRTVPRHPRAAHPPEQLSFRQVLDRLRRAERAERNGAPELALSLLDEIDQGAARSVLREERLLTRVLALCDQGDVTHARQRARELAGAQNDSIYVSRLRESCARTEDEP